MKFKKVVLLPDIHYPEHSKGSIDLVKKFIKDFSPDEVIYQGDNLDMGVISHWNKDKRKTVELKRLKKDYDGFTKDILDPIEAVTKKTTKFIWIRGNHECLDGKTELLTERGWLTHEKISDSDKVFTMNPKTRCGEWVKIEKIIRRKHNGSLNRINSVRIDLLATDDHKIFSFKRGTNKYSYTKISDITKERYCIPTTAKSDNEEYKITDDEIIFAGWILTDGYIDKRGDYTIYQSKSIKNILDVLNRLGYSYGISKRTRDNIVINGKRVKNILEENTIRVSSKHRDEISKYIKSKDHLPDWVSRLSDRQFEILLRTLIEADGSIHKSSKNAAMLYGRKSFLEEVQIACITHNFTASLSVYREGVLGEGYRLNLPLESKRFSFEKDKNLSKEKYKGIVWDLTVKNHNFMIRRNGKCHFTGNCWSDQYIDKNPELEGIIEPEICLNLEARGYKVIPFNKLYKIGKLNVAHGYYTNKYHSAKTLDVFEESICYGHMHSPQMHSKCKPMDSTDFHAAYGLPCLCTLNPEYGAGRPNAWINGFGVAYIFPNGAFNIYPIIIVNNKFVFNDKVYETKM